MDSKHLMRKGFISLIVLLLSALAFFPALLTPGWVAIPSGLAVLTAISLWGLFTTIVSLQNQPRHMLETLEQENLTDLARSSSPWAFAAKGIVGQIEKLVAQREKNHLFLKQLTSHITDALLCYTDQGRVVYANESLLQMAQIQSLTVLASLQSKNPVLAAAVVGEQTIVLKSDDADTHFQIQRNRFSLGDEWHTLVVITNISAGVYRAESQSWHRLLRILNHETANTVAPVASLAATLARRYGHLNPELEEGLGVIGRRIDRMMEFAGRVRLFSRLPQPVMTPFNLNKLIEDTTTLMQARWPVVNLLCSLPDSAVVLNGDASLLQQALINLLQNSAEALTNTPAPVVSIELNHTSSNICIVVADNGPGIPPELTGDVFVPLFTTKPHGSGLGLSLSREIAIQHGGKLQLLKNTANGASFELSIPKERIEAGF